MGIQEERQHKEIRVPEIASFIPCVRQSASADTYAAVACRTAGDKLENVVPHSGLIIGCSIDFDIRLVPPRGPCQRGFCKQFIISVGDFVAPNKWVDISTCGDACGDLQNKLLTALQNPMPLLSKTVIGDIVFRI